MMRDQLAYAGLVGLTQRALRRTRGGSGGAMRVSLLLLAAVAMLASRPAYSEQPVASALGARVHADSVTFRFVPAEFRMVVSGRTSRWMRLRDLAIREVTVAGGWNQWSAEAWPLHRLGRVWTLTCPLSAVADRDTVPFKFVVNEEWWVQPPPDTPNQLNSGIHDTTMNLFFVRPQQAAGDAR
jgi:hypothetical protein